MYLHSPGSRGRSGSRCASELKRISEPGYRRWLLEQERAADERLGKMGIEVEPAKAAKDGRFLTLLQIEKKYGAERLAELNQEAAWLEEVEALSAEARVQALAAKGWSQARFFRQRRRLRLYGVPGLLRPFSAQKGKERIDSEIIGFIRGCHLRRKHASTTRVWELTQRFANERGLPVPSLTTVRRVIRRIPDCVSVYHRRGSQEYSKTHTPITRRERVPEPAQWICGDHNLMDQQLWNNSKQALGGELQTGKDRPWLTCLMDLHNNDPVAVVLSWQGNSDTICLALRRCLLGRTGRFRFLYVDQGDDFNSARVKSVCRDLGIEIIPAQGYHPQAKGALEQFFGFLNERLADELGSQGYVGNRPSNRPESVTPILDLQSLENVINFWIATFYRDRKSDALGGKSPNDLYAEAVERGFVPQIPDPRALDLLLMPSRLRKVYRDGIHLNGFVYWDDRLIPYINDRTETGENHMVEARVDPGNLGYAFVFDKDGNYICSAVNEPLARWGATEQDRQRLAQKRRTAKEYVEGYAEALRIAHSDNDAIMEETILDRMALHQQSVLPQAVNQTGGLVQTFVPKFDKAVRAIARGEGGTPARQQGVTSEVVDWEPRDENGVRVCAEKWRMRKRYSQAGKIAVIPDRYFDFDRPLRDQVARDEELAAVPEQIKDRFRKMGLFEE